jgi:ankyrin repeat protein
MTSTDQVKRYNIDLATRAAYENDLVTLKRLIEKEGVSVDAIDEDKIGLIHNAANGGSVEAMQYLLSKGANTNLTDPAGRTAVFYAIIAPNFNTEIAEMLLASGAKLDHVAGNGETIPLLLSRNVGTSAKAAQWLLSKNVDITKLDPTPELNPLLAAIKNKNTELAKIYIAAGVDMSAVDGDGVNALMAAMATYKPEIVDLVLDASKKQGIDLATMRDNGGQTALHTSALLINYPSDPALFNAENRKILNDHITISRKIMSLGIPVNATDRSGQTALHIAASKGNEMLVPLLLEAGANVTLHDNNGKTAYTNATSFNKSVVADMLAERMKGNPFYHSNSDALPRLNPNDVLGSMLNHGTRSEVYNIIQGKDAWVPESDAAVSPLKGYEKKREGILLVVEGSGPHQKDTYNSALYTYTHLTGSSRSEAERFIIPLSQSIEDIGNFDNKSSPSSQYSTGYRALMEADSNQPLRDVTYLSASYYRSDDASFRYDKNKEARLRAAEPFYSALSIAGIGIASGNDDTTPAKAATGKSQPLRANKATVFVGAAEKAGEGNYVMKNYSDRGPHITAPLPPLYDVQKEAVKQGTSFATPAFNAYRLALFTGTAHLTPREVDAALFTTARQNVVDDAEGKPYEFTSNGTVVYNDKVGMGVADIGAAHTRAQELDVLKAAWLKTKGQDVPLRLELTADASAMRKIEVGGATKYEYRIPVTKDMFIQQFTSHTLGSIGNDGKPMQGHARVVAPNGFAQHARTDVYGNASLPAMYGIRLKAGDSLTILADQPLREAKVDITGYAPDSFFASIMQREMARQAVSQLKDVKAAPPCEQVATQIFNAKAALCAISR